MAVSLVLEYAVLTFQKETALLWLVFTEENMSEMCAHI